jgi:uridine phosphorylase
MKVSLHFPGKIEENVILHDDSGKIVWLTGFLKNVRMLENKRYLSYSGEWKKKPVTLIATKMGAPNTALVVDEIADLGAKNIIKLGTFGAIRKDVSVGDIYIPTDAIRTDGVTEAYAKASYPAKPSPKLAKLAKTVAKGQGIEARNGTIWTASAYQPIMLNSSPDKRFRISTWKGKAFGVEMETSALFVCASLKKAHALSLLICNRDWETIDGFRKGEAVDWNAYRESDVYAKNLLKLAELAFGVIEKL